MLIRKYLQNLLPFGVYHQLSEITHRNWTPETFGTIDSEGTFHLQHDAGFFSNCSVILYEIARSKNVINNIDVSNSFTWYKDNQDEDIWRKLFIHSVPNPKKNYGYWGKTLVHHTKYKKLNLRVIKPLLDSYFSPSDLVTSRKNELLKKYNIDYSKTLGVNYRGTDKNLEIPTTSVNIWIKQTKKKLSKLHPDTRILIQTDQHQVRDRFVEEFGDKAFYFEEMPVTRGNKVIHEIIEKKKRNDFVINLLASTLILANCRNLITHTGNVAFWTVLFRQNLNNVKQM